ncbi:MAG: OmpA family protein [Endomicrobia bacterium]|nr:OmpA family protein [Endomicrobiia bacterium]
MKKRILLSFLFMLFFSVCIYARQELITYDLNGNPFIRFDIADGSGENYADGKNPAGDEFFWTLVPQHIKAFENASFYWAQLFGNLPTNTDPVTISIGIYNYINDDSISGYGASGGGMTYLTNAILFDNFLDYYVGWNPEYTDQAFAQIRIGVLNFPWLDYMGQDFDQTRYVWEDTSDWFFKPMQLLPNNLLVSNMVSVIVHEMAHSMGIMNFEYEKDGNLYFMTYNGSDLNLYNRHFVDSFGTPAAVDQIVRLSASTDTVSQDFRIIKQGDSSLNDPNMHGFAFFQGPNVMSVLNGAIFTTNNPYNIGGLPILAYEGEHTDFSHLELRNSMMSHQTYRNWTTFMEAELALLQDIGIDLDRRNFFGYSIYNDNGIFDVSNNFYARNSSGTAYISGAYNSSAWAIGLHIYGTSNTVTMNGEVLSNGMSSAGIRLEGWNNILEISPLSNIRADGENSAGLMVSYGRDHKIAHRGNLSAIGDGGIGARFDFGDNILGDMYEYRGSYKRRSANFDPNASVNPYWNPFFWNMDDLLWELDGPLVESFDVTGTISGEAAAIYISHNAFVNQINIMSGAQIFGDIISDWAPTFDFSQINHIFDHVQYYYYNYNIIINGQPMIMLGDLNDLKTVLTFGYKADSNGFKTSQQDETFSLDYSGNIIARGALDIEIAGGNFNYSGKISGVSKIDKTGSGLFLMSGDGSDFNGTFTQAAGNTRITGKYFAGISSITAGILEFANGTELSETAQIGIYDESKLNITSSDLNFNSQLKGNGEVNKTVSGLFILSGDASGFTGVFNQITGDTIVSGRYFAGISSITSGTLEFATGALFSTSAQIGIYNEAKLNITSLDINFNSQLKGDGEINKTAAGLFLMSGNNSDFTGLFNQTAGDTKVSGKYFTGISSITSGTLEFANGTELNETALIGIYNEGKLNITASSLTFNSQIKGNGDVNKTSAGLLSMSGDASAFTGIFRQTAGITIVSGKYFAGISSITSGTLEFANGTELSGTAQLEIYSSAKLNIAFSDTFTLNNIIKGNGNIDKTGSGLFSMIGDGSSFTGIFRQFAGDTKVTGKYFAGISSITAGILELANGAELSSTAQLEIYNTAKLNIAFSDPFSLNNQIKGNGNIDKTGTGLFSINGDGFGFTGIFTQIAGDTKVSGKYFAGISSITVGILEFANGTELSATAQIGIYNESKLNITASNLVFNGQLRGDGEVNKTSSGLLSLSGDSSGFTGIFTQAAGDTKVSGRYFAGISSITAGTLEFANGTGLSETAQIGIYNSVKLNITSSNLVFSSQLKGNGEVNKTGSGLLSIIGDAFGFTGTFIQTAGDTKVSGRYFAGISSITAGTLEFATGTELSGTAQLEIYNSARLNITSSNLTFNNHIIGNGLINKTTGGLFTMSGDGSGFTGIFTQTAGNTIVNGKYFAGISSITAGTLEFANGTELSGTTQLEIYNSANLNISFSDSFTLNNLVKGNGNIDKTGNGLISIIGDGSGFSGVFRQVAGNTIVSGKYFAGISSITIGILEFANGTELSATAQIGIYNESKLNITSSDLIFNSQLKGNGEVNKTVSGLFTLSGDASGFTGVFNQTAGDTKVSGKYFAGISSITAGTLEFASGALFSTSAQIGIYNEAKLNITSSNLAFSGQLKGNGSINKIAAGLFLLSGDASGFSGLFTQIAGETKVSGKYFAGISSITAGTLEFASGTELNAAAQIGIYSEAKLNITSLNLTFNSWLKGNGEVNKTAGGLFLLSGDAAGFTGIFRQTAGDTKVSGRYFAGISSITAGTLEFVNGTELSETTQLEIYNTSKLNIAFSDVFTLDNIIKGNGNIDKTGTGLFSINGDGSGFTGVFRQTAGYTTVNGKYFAGISSITAGALEFANGTELSTTAQLEIYNSGKLNISFSDSFTLDNLVKGNGNIDKTGIGLLSLSGDASGFSGIFTQTTGNTIVSGKYFAGISSITAGTLEFANGTELSAAAQIGIYNESKLNITASNIVFNSQLKGNGEVNKTSLGLLFLSGDASGFTGIFNQTEGDTKVSGKYFAGISSITVGTLEFANGTELSATAQIGVYNESKLNITASNLMFNSKMQGNGEINKTSAGLFSLSGDAAGFTGMFRQTAGNTIVSGKYFAGISSITAGIIEFASGTILSETVQLGIYNTAKLNITSSNLIFNSQLKGNGEVNKTGIGLFTMSGDASGFTGIFRQTAGDTKVSGKYFAGISSITAGTIEFANGTELSGTTQLEIYNNAKLNIAFSDGFMLNNIVKGNGRIDKTGNGIFTINSDVSGFTGIFTQTAGYTIINSKYFAGISSITAGTLEFANGTELSGTAQLEAYNSGKLNIAFSDAFVLNNLIKGNGKIDKTGSGLLTINSDVSGFTGVFTQTAGHTKVSGKYFAGISSITSGTLEFAAGTELSENSQIGVYNGAKLNITASDLTFSGQLKGNGEINKTDAGNLYFQGINIFDGSFNVKAGELKFLHDASYKGGNLSVLSGAALDIKDCETYINTIFVENFDTAGLLKMDIKNNAGGARINVEQTASVSGILELHAGFGEYKDRSYQLISYGNLNGEFQHLDISGITAESDVLWVLNYDRSNNIVFEISGKNISDFSNKVAGLKGNSKSVAQAIDELSAVSDPHGSLMGFANEIAGIDSVEAQIKALTDLSGYFIANLTVPGFSSGPDIKEAIGQNAGIWTFFNIGSEKINGEKDSLPDYKDNSIDAFLGFNGFMFGEEVLAGAYAGFSKNSITQGNNEADGIKKEFGIYAKMEKELFEIKALLSADFTSFDTQRYIEIGSIQALAKGSLPVFAINAEAEASLKYRFSQNFLVRHYLGFDLSDISYGSFAEKGASGVNLNVESGGFVRSAAAVGVGLNYENKSFLGYIKGEGKYLFSGYKPEITSVFEGTDTQFKSFGTEIGRFAAGLGLGGEVSANENWKFFANAKYYTAKSYENIYGNAGVRYIFGQSTKNKVTKANSESSLLSSQKVVVGNPSSNKDNHNKNKPAKKSKKFEKKTFSLDGTSFAVGSTQLTWTAKKALQDIAEEIKKTKYTNITIEGHTDSAGNQAANKNLSEARAKAVHDELVEAGIDPFKIDYDGFGSSMPVATNETQEGRAQNRRVEITVE